MPKITKEDLRRDLSLAKEVIGTLGRKAERLAELTSILLKHSETCNLNAKTIWALSQEEGGWSDDEE